jgi:pentose-5-phosphate-3-epimerase
LDSSCDKLDDRALALADLVLLMSVKAGWAGQEFNLSVWDKIKRMATLRKERGWGFRISVDGGVTRELVNEMAAQGVDEVFVGKRIFEPDLAENLKSFGFGVN